MGIIDDARERVQRWVLDSNDDVSTADMQAALAKAGFSTGLAKPSDETPRAMLHDPYSLSDWGGWRNRPSVLTYEALRQVSVANSIIAAIINLRIHQVAAFAKPQKDKFGKGYRVTLRDRSRLEKNEPMTDAETKQALEIERMIETTGILQDNEKPSDRDSFKAFCKKSVRDILTYDAWAYERIRDRSGRISKFIALPSETIRPAVADIEHYSTEELRQRISHVQVYENTVVAEFGADDISYNVMNPRSDLRVNGFGFSPIEQIIRLTTAWLFGFEYNTKFFMQGSAVKGLLNIKGTVPDRQMRAFRRMWYSMIAGVENAWKTPILNAEDVQWHSMHSNNREMEFGAWMDWLTKLICAVFGADPVEINFVFGSGGSGGGGSSMFDRRPNAAEMTEARDKGLGPLMDFIEDSINAYLVWEINPDFEFEFTGYDAKAESRAREQDNADVKHSRTVNEIRASRNEDPLPWGDVILDPQAMAAKQAHEGGGPDGAPSDGGEDDDDFFGGDDADDESPGEGETDPEEDEKEAEDAAKKDGKELLAASEALITDAQEILRKSQLRGSRRLLEITIKDD